MFEGLNDELLKSTCIEVIDNVNKIREHKQLSRREANLSHNSPVKKSKTPNAAKKFV